jgi:hypothetical protein
VTAEGSWFDFGQVKGVLFFSICPDFLCGQPLSNSTSTGGAFLKVIRPEHEPDHSLPSNTDVKNEFRLIFTSLSALGIAQGHV